MCFLAMIAYFWPGPGSSEVILQMGRWASVNGDERTRALFFLFNHTRI